MTRKKSTIPISPFKRGQIIEALLHEEEQETISDRLDVSIRTIQRLWKKYKEKGNCDIGTSTGRPKKTSTKEDRLIVRQVKKDRFVTSPEIKKNFPDLSISERTVRRRINEVSPFASYWAARTPFINEVNRAKRLQWAIMHQHWTVDQWNKVLWSDESPFVFFYHAKRRVWRMHNERYKPWCTTGTIKHDKKINVWGCFSASGVGNLYRIEGNLNQYQYQTILETQMIPSKQRLFGQNQWIFQQDNDPKHTANMIKAWLASNHVVVIPWPAQSPDLNPIENLWSILDYSVRTRKPTNEAALFQTLSNAWAAISPNTLQSLVTSMPSRCQAVIEASGYATGY